MASRAAEPGLAGSTHVARMARGGGLNLIGAVTNQGSLLLITLLIARTLGSDQLGRYALCYAVLTLLGLLSLFGFRSAMTRFVAIHLADDDAASLRGTLRFGMVVTVGSATVLGVSLVLLSGPIAGLFHDPHLVVGLRLTGCTLPAATFSDAALAATQGWRTQVPFTLIGRVLEPGLRLALTGLLLAMGLGLTGAFVAVTVAAWLAAVLAGLALLGQARGVAPATPQYAVRAVLRYSMVSWMSTLAATGLIWADTLLLGALLDSRQVGLYNVATRLVTLAIFVMAPINATFGPHIAHLYHVGSPSELQHVYQAASGWIVRLSLPAFVLLVVAPGELLGLFGPQFRVAALVTVILAFGQLVNAATGPCGTLLNMSGRVAMNMADNVGVLVLNVAMNLWLIPRAGIVGSAIAWSLSLALVNAVRVVQVRVVVGSSPFTASTTKALLAGAAAGVTGWLVEGLLPASLALLGVALVVLVSYVAVVLALGVSADDRLALASMVRRRSRSAGALP